MEDVLTPAGGPVDEKGRCQTAGPFFIPCLRCGECCRKYQVRVDLDEAARLADGLGMSVDSFLTAYADERWPGERSFLVRQEDGHCIFLKEAIDGPEMTVCAIHSFKPASCREWCAGLDQVECRQGLMRILGISREPLGEVVSPDEGQALLDAHLKALAASRRN